MLNKSVKPIAGLCVLFISENEKIWYIICLPVCIVRLSLHALSSSRSILFLNSVWMLLSRSWNQESQTPFGGHHTRILSAPGHPCLSRSQVLPANRRLIEDKLTETSPVDGRRSSTIQNLKFETKAQTRNFTASSLFGVPSLTVERESEKSSRLRKLLGIFKDVRFYPILNFGHFWAPLFSRCFYPIVNFGHFWAPPRL